MKTKNGVQYIEYGSVTQRDLCLVFFHGYGATAQDLSDFAKIELPFRGHWIFPEGPLPSVVQGGRAWFPLKTNVDTNQIQLSEESVFHLNQQVEFLTHWITSLAEPKKLVLGGFSQGAVMALNLALKGKEPPSGLVLLSGTLFPPALIKEDEKTHFCKNGNFFQSHGEGDSILDFSGAKAANGLLCDLGWKGTFFNFRGGHEIPPLALSKMQQFLCDCGERGRGV